MYRPALVHRLSVHARGRLAKLVHTCVAHRAIVRAMTSVNGRMDKLGRCLVAALLAVALGGCDDREQDEGADGIGNDSLGGDDLGGDDGLGELDPRCQSLCSSEEPECTDGVDSCELECQVRVVGMSSICATCLLDNANGGSCGLGGLCCPNPNSRRPCSIVRQAAKVAWASTPPVSTRSVHRCARAMILPVARTPNSAWPSAKSA